MKKRNYLIVLLLSFILLSCTTTNDGKIEIIGTQTIVPTKKATKIPPPTETLTPTATTSPTDAPQPETNLGYSTREFSKKGDFSFQNIVGYYLDSQYAMVAVFSKNNEVLISFSTTPKTEITSTAEVYLQSFVDRVSNDFHNFSKGEFEKVEISGKEGLSVSIIGELFGDPTQGKIVVVPFLDNQFFVMFGIGAEIENIDYWDMEGDTAFSMIKESIEFNLEYQPESGCLISNDNSYGFTTTNPIKVGGGFLEGPPRERAFLDNLRGPDGQLIEYSRLGSIPEGDAILDIYSVTYAGLSEPVTLYINEYEFNDLFSPQGFSCDQPFNLSAP